MNSGYCDHVTCARLRAWRSQAQLEPCHILGESILSRQVCMQPCTRVRSGISVYLSNIGGGGKV